MRQIAIFYHYEPEGWWADSPDLPGWTSAGESLEEVRALSIEGAREFAEGDVIVMELLPEEHPSTGVLASVGTIPPAERSGLMSYAAAIMPMIRESPMYAAPAQGQGEDIFFQLTSPELA